LFGSNESAPQPQNRPQPDAAAAGSFGHPWGRRTVPQAENMPRLSRAFGNLKVRPKLMVLHNLFFLVLACAAYFSLIPLFQKQVSDARRRELELVRQVFSSDIPVAHLKGLETYEFRKGTANELQVPRPVRVWLDANPGEIWWQSRNPYTYRRDPETGVYYRLKTDLGAYADLVERARLTLFVVLGAIYILAVVILELAIMPQYVYRPLRLLLEADRATQEGDRDHELIPEDSILSDEIGQIMRSRNAAVAELRRHEDSLAAALQRLEEQDRLASLGLLSAGVAHELNTPLTVLHGSIEKLRETTTDPHTLERLARMERVTERLRKISEGLLDFSRTRKQRLEPVLVRPLVDEAWGLVAIDERASDVVFRNDVATQHEINGNPDRLIQVFVNLLRNALDAVKSNGGKARGEIRVGSRGFVWNDRPWVSITVEDNGPGIPADLLPEIFEAFVTTRLDARGTGLGLTVTEGIVSQHGGTIAAFNRPHGGATLEVRFPASVKRAVHT
jgi:signal transduction histidine kinase